MQHLKDTETLYIEAMSYDEATLQKNLYTHAVGLLILLLVNNQ